MSKIPNKVKLTNIALGLLLSVISASAEIVKSGDVSPNKDSIINPEAIENLQAEAFIKIAEKTSSGRISYQAAKLLFPFLKSEPGLLDQPEAQEKVGKAIRALQGPSDKEKFSKSEREEIINRIMKIKTKDGKLQSISAAEMKDLIEKEGKAFKAEKARNEEAEKAKKEAAEKQQKAEAHKLVGSARAPSDLERETLGKLGITYDPAQEKKALIDAIKAGGEALERKQTHKIEELKKEQKLAIEELESRQRRELESASQGLNDSKKIVGNLGDFAKELERQ